MPLLSPRQGGRQLLPLQRSAVQCSTHTAAAAAVHRAKRNCAQKPRDTPLPPEQACPKERTRAAPHTHLHVLSVRHNLLPPHQRFALLVHLPQLVLPVPDLTHVYLDLLGFCKELLHVISQAGGGGVPSGGVVAIAPLLNIPPAIALAVVVVLVVVLLLLVLLLVALLLVGWRVARLPAVLLLVVVLAIARSIVLDYV